MQYHSQAGQDYFVHTLLGAGRYFLEIGSGDGDMVPNGSNTLFLEERGWRGILLDNNAAYIEHSTEARKGSVSICADATDFDYLTELQKFNCPSIIDYISLDVDEANVKVLEIFPFETYQFKIMTYEHDMYAGREECKERKSKAKEILLSKGYHLLCEDVGCDSSENKPFEDWYVNPQFVDLKKYKFLQSVNAQGADICTLLESISHFLHMETTKSFAMLNMFSQLTKIHK